MDIKEIKNKSKKSLDILLADKREKLREMRFKVSNRQLKDVKSIDKMKKDIARILTVKNNI
ncbi:50S ribosomal protein L29 [Candidatus Falkowbacteria bacterium]|jgi:ribosomal protein L29|nr:50S ribosomal protein L29 [Candidatus Falkowbacteria bacterium]MBT4433002.1 50S ribosomal protein L29 [Candidatus Falkowbacteria bacterium]